MKLSVNIIFSALKEAFPQAVLHKKSKNDNDLSLNCPHYHDGPFSFRSHRIYIVPSDQLPSNFVADGPCLLITPELQNKAYHKNISVITAAGAGVVSLFNQVITIFEQYTQWDDTLQDLVFHNAPLEEYLKCSYPFIGNAMSVHNNNFAYLARVGESVSSEKRALSHERDFIDPDFLMKVDAQISQSIFYSRDVIHFQEDCFHQEYFFLNLFDGNTAAGCLVVTSNSRPFAPQDSVLVQHLGKYLEAALTYAAFSGSGKNLRRDSLLEYLSGKEPNEDKILYLKTVSPFSKLKKDQRLYCLAGMCRDSEITEQYIAYQIERALPESVCVLFDSKIVILCANLPKQTPAAFFEEVRALLKKYSITAGCSNPFTDFFDLKYCYRQAEFALQLAGNDPGNQILHHFKQYTLEFFLRFGCSVLPVRLICAECIMKLSEHDENAAVSYCDSLRIYLDTGMNSTETARRLNIKRNTFLARLERILRYVDLDLENEDDRLYLQISLRLIQRSPLSRPRPEQ
ncbi:MAG: PucR family transcriptional regulator [Oscillospiraceae bacterium]